MKYIAFLFILFFNQSYGQYAIVSLKVTDSLRRPIIFFEPLNGHANRYVPSYTIKNTDGSGFMVKRKIKIDEPVAIEIHFGFEPLWLYIEPNQQIYVDINLNRFTSNSTNGGLKIRGQNAKGNEYFNEFNFLPGKKFKLIDNIISNCEAGNARQKIECFQKKIDSSFAFLKVLKGKKLITPSFYQLITNDLGLAYVTEFGVESLRSNTGYHESCKILDSLYRIYDPQNKQNLQGFFSNTYYYRYGIYRNTKTYNSALLQSDTILPVNNMGYNVLKNFIPFIYLKGEIMKFEWGMALYQYETFFPDKFQMSDLDYYSAKFPDSWLFQYVNLKSQKNKTPPSNFASQVDSTKITILDEDSLNSFTGVINRYFKNKIVYVDFWATWCLPCKEEFSFNKFVDSFCVKNHIERLYVSFDVPASKQNVLQNIYSFRLYGKHLLLNKEIFDDIINKIYNGNTRYSIPRYLIIDNDHVVEINAERPSSGKALLNQLKLYINK